MERKQKQTHLLWTLNQSPRAKPLAVWVCEMSSSNSPSRSRGERARTFDGEAKRMCWAKAETVPGRHPERWRKDSAGNILCKRLFNCQGCLCFEYDHIIPFSKGLATALLLLS